MSAQKTILLVEDHDDIRQAMTRLLEHSGHHVVTASSVATGIASFDGQSIVLLDLELPDGLGTQVLDRIRQLTPQPRIGFITAVYETHHLRQHLFPGDAIFSKPIDITQFTAWINQK